MSEPFSEWGDSNKIYERNKKRCIVKMGVKTWLEIIVTNLRHWRPWKWINLSIKHTVYCNLHGSLGEKYDVQKLGIVPSR